MWDYSMLVNPTIRLRLQPIDVSLNLIGNTTIYFIVFKNSIVNVVPHPKPHQTYGYSESNPTLVEMVDIISQKLY